VTIPTTYAGGAKGRFAHPFSYENTWSPILQISPTWIWLTDSLEDVLTLLMEGIYTFRGTENQDTHSIRSSLDIFGGALVKFEELVKKSINR